MSGPARPDVFLGRWSFARVIEDSHAGHTATAQGIAQWREDGTDQMRYHEDAELNLPYAAPMRATREYLWQSDETGIDICFADGRPFHRMVLHEATQEAVHLCAPDIYKVRYAFQRWPEWVSLWTVSGPKKNYIMRTTYTKLPD